MLSVTQRADVNLPTESSVDTWLHNYLINPCPCCIWSAYAKRIQLANCIIGKCVCALAKKKWLGYMLDCLDYTTTVSKTMDNKPTETGFTKIC